MTARSGDQAPTWLQSEVAPILRGDGEGRVNEVFTKSVHFRNWFSSVFWCACVSFCAGLSYSWQMIRGNLVFPRLGMKAVSSCAPQKGMVPDGWQMLSIFLSGGARSTPKLLRLRLTRHGPRQQTSPLGALFWFKRGKRESLKASDSTEVNTGELLLQHDLGPGSRQARGDLAAWS